MDLASSSGRLGERLQHVYTHWEERRKTTAEQLEVSMPHQPAFSIALSREAGTQGSLIAHEVGKRLNWAVYDHELLEHISQEMGVRTKLLESVDEKQMSWLLEAFEDLISVLKVSEMAYVHHLAKTALALGSHGECVIVGRGTSQILPMGTTLRVRLIAPFEERILVMCRKLGIARDEAERKVKAIDEERRKFVQDHFLHDPTDPRHYDLILDASRFGAPACVELIVEALRHLQNRAASEGRISPISV